MKVPKTVFFTKKKKLFAFPNKTNFKNYFSNFSEESKLLNLKTTYISHLNNFSEQSQL
jgi:hypothetical protein